MPHSWLLMDQRFKNGREPIGHEEVRIVAHRNRSDFCDLRLRCPSRTPEIAAIPRQGKAMLHCDLRVRWKVASDLRFRVAISEPKTPSFCGISGTRKSLAIAIVRFWCAKKYGCILWTAANNLEEIPLKCQRFRKGVGGRGLATNKPRKTAQNILQKCVPLLLRGDIGERVQKRGLNLWHKKDFFAPTPSVRQPLFETSGNGSSKF